MGANATHAAAAGADRARLIVPAVYATTNPQFSVCGGKKNDPNMLSSFV